MTDSAEMFAATPPLASAAPSGPASSAITRSSTQRSISPIRPWRSAAGRNSAGCDEPPVGFVGEPQERLVAHHAAVRERDDRLEVKHEEVILERPAQALEHPLPAGWIS